MCAHLYGGAADQARAQSFEPMLLVEPFHFGDDHESVVTLPLGRQCHHEVVQMPGEVDAGAAFEAIELRLDGSDQGGRHRLPTRLGTQPIEVDAEYQLRLGGNQRQRRVRAIGSLVRPKRGRLAVAARRDEEARRQGACDRCSQSGIPLRNRAMLARTR